jgi:SRSO17 transposase
VIEETSFLKKGRHSVGVGTQYSGITGKLDNCQVGVFLVYSSPQGQTFYDRALYLPRDWTDDPARRRQAVIPDTTRFATKPQLARMMTLRALDDGLPVAWVTGDEVYGGDYHLRVALEAREQPYALTVKASHVLWCELRQRQARTLVAAAPASAWERRSCGEGSKGPRLYDWLRIPINQPYDDRWQRWLVARRGLTNPDDPRSIAYVLVFAPATTSLATLAEVIGERWSIERAFADSKGAVGLDQYEVRSWPWPVPPRTTSSLSPHRGRGEKRGSSAEQSGAVQAPARALVRLSVPELRRLLWTLLRPPLPTRAFLWAWSRWRRHHQAVARYCQYNRHAVLLVA